MNSGNVCQFAATRSVPAGLADGRGKGVIFTCTNDHRADNPFPTFAGKARQCQYPLQAGWLTAFPGKASFCLGFRSSCNPAAPGRTRPRAALQPPQQHLWCRSAAHCFGHWLPSAQGLVKSENSTVLRAVSSSLSFTLNQNSSF